MSIISKEVPNQSKVQLSEEELIAIRKEKARLRKKRNREKNPKANQMNDLRARVRKRCLEKFGKLDQEWIQQQCELRLNKRLLREQQQLLKQRNDFQTFQHNSDGMTTSNGTETTVTPTEHLVHHVSNLTPADIDLVQSLIKLRYSRA